MASTRDIRRRIKSVKNTRQITKAMQLVAASKMKKAQQAALAGRPYASLLAQMLAALVERSDVPHLHPLLEEREVKTRGILVLSTDKGLCGPLNSNLFRKVTEIERSAQFVVVGRKGGQFVGRTGRNLFADFVISDKVGFPEVRTMAKFLVEKFLDHTIDTVEILYPRFVNTLVQEPTLYPLLPLTDIQTVIDTLRESLGDGDHVPGEQDQRHMLFEPSVYQVMADLLPLYVNQQIYQFCLESKASEQSARMVAMKTASDNASNLVDDLTLEYNKARQASITAEILEISAATLASS